MATIIGTRSPLFYRQVAGGLPAIINASAFTGNVFFVDSAVGADTAGFGTTPDAPFDTIDFAVGQCTANQGDKIFVLPGHVESIANATALAIDVAGIEIIGLGKGTSRPTITFSAAGSNIPITVANVKMSNFLLLGTAGVDVTSAITVTGADCELTDIECQESGATAQFIAMITLGTGSARCRIIRPIHRGHASGDANANAITCAVASDGVYIEDPDFDGLYSNGAIYNVTLAMTNLTVKGGHLRNRHATRDSGVSVVATTTGQLLSLRIRTATNDADGFNLAIVAAAMQVYDPLVVNADGERGGAWGTASAAA